MISRRRFVATSALLAVSPRLELQNLLARTELDDFIRSKMKRDQIPGVAACLCTAEGIRWAGTYGWANLERRVPMTIDTLQNICSISKTVTTAALMQLRDAGRLRLDDDVNDYLPFPIRNPNHRRTAITIRHLTTHQSSIRDGSAYARRYACGDPSLSLGEWIRSYFTGGGTDFNAAENFHPWAPASRWDYCNVAYGLIAYLVERISGTAFPTYCRERVFAPLGMPETSWFLADIDTSRHATPYTLVAEGKARGPSWGGVAQGVLREAGADGPLAPGLQPNCLYNHPNYPDGFLRTSVNQLSRYARAHLNGGRLGGHRLLREETIREMMTPYHRGQTRIQGLTWYGWTASSVRNQILWGHGGSDPGINTDFRVLPSEGVAAIAFMNTNGVRPEEITERILMLAPALAN